jgi:hypothetical protein
VVVGDEKLRHRKPDAGNKDRRPHCGDAAEAGKRPDQPERHDDGEEGQLTADHRAQIMQVERGDALQRDDGRAERAERDRRGVGDERQARRRERGEAESNQDGSSHRDGRAKSGRALEERTEAEGDEQQLQAAVGGDRRDARAQNGEQPPVVRQLIQEDHVEHDPADWEQAVRPAVHGRGGGHSGRHAEYEDRNRE